MSEDIKEVDPIEKLEKATAAHTKAMADKDAAHAKVSNALSQKIMHLETQTHMHIAEKDALGQSVQELMQNNVRLRATTILLEKQLKATMDEKDAEIKRLNQKALADGDTIAQLKAGLDAVQVNLDQLKRERDDLQGQINCNASLDEEEEADAA